MFNFVCSLVKRGYLFIFLAVFLLCGCSSVGTSQTPQATQPSPTPTPHAQIDFTSYVGKWQVHGSLLTINADHTGLELWNVGPCSTAMCNGNANVIFTDNADGSIKGTIQSISYSQWNGDPAPAGYQPGASDPQVGDTFQLQHSGAHLLYTTWFGRLSDLNNYNRYWCDSYASNAGWQQCGA